MEISIKKAEQLGIFVNTNAEDDLYENNDFNLCLSLDSVSISGDKKISLKITNNKFHIAFKENQSLLFAFSYDELIYHALSKQKNYVMIQLNLKEDFQNWIKKEDKIYIKCINKEEEIIFEKISIGCSINTEYPDDGIDENEDEFENSQNKANKNNYINNDYSLQEAEDNSEIENYEGDYKYFGKIDKVPENLVGDMGTIYFNNYCQYNNESHFANSCIIAENNNSDININNNNNNYNQAYYQIPENMQQQFYCDNNDNLNQINFNDEKFCGQNFLKAENQIENFNNFEQERFNDASIFQAQALQNSISNNGNSSDNIFKMQKRKKRLAENDPRRFEDL